MSQPSEAEERAEGDLAPVAPRVQDFGQILDTSPDAIIVTDEAGRIVSFSRGAEAAFGYRANETVGQHIEMLMPERYRTGHPALRHAFATGANDARYMGERGQIVGRRKDGSEFPAEASISRLNRGGRTMLAVILRDVTDRVATERALRQSEEEARALFEQAADAIVVISPDGIVGEVNRSTEALLGCASGEIEGRPFIDFVPPEDREPLLGRFAEVQYGSPIESERDILRPDGKRVPVQLRGNALADGRVLVAMRDLTETRAAARAIEASEELFRTTFEQAPIGISVLDADLKRLWVNRALTEFLGYTTKELLGERPRLVTHPEDMPAEQVLLDEMARGERDTYEIEKRFIRKDGSIAWACAALRAVRDSDGKITRYIGQVQDITSRKAAEAGLRESEERARALFEEAADAIAVIRPDGIVDEANESAAALVHVPRDEIAGTYFQDFVPPGEQQETAESFALVLSGHLLEIEQSLLRSDGTVVRVHLKAQVLSDGRVLVAMRDLSERLAAEHALQASEEQYRMTFEWSPIGITVMGPDCKRTFVNQAFAGMLGYTRDELIGDNYLSVTDPRDLEDELFFTRALATGERQSYEMEKRYLRKDGMPVWGHVFGTAIRDESGVLLRYVAQVLDISERKRAEQALRESEELFRTTFESSPIGISLGSPEGRRIWVNDAFCRFTGYTRDELLSGVTFQEITSPQDVRQAEEYVQRLTSGEIDSYSIEKKYLRKDGEVVWGRLSAAALRDDAGSVRRYIGQVVDITESKRAEEALRASEARLREAQAIAHLGSWELDLQTNRVVYSDEVYKLLEIEPLPIEPSTERFYAVVHPEDRDLVRETFRDSVARWAPYEMDHRLLMPDGRVKWVRESGKTSYAEHGTPLRTIGTIQDMTERYLSEQATRESEERLREAQAIAHLGSWELDLVTDDLAWSEEIYRIFEFDPGAFEPSYEAFLEGIHPDDRAQVDEAYRQSVLDRRPYTIEHRLLMGDGRIKWVRETGRTVYSDDGQALRSVGTVQDITERHAAEDALRESEELFRTTFEASPVGVTITDAGGQRLWVNSAFCEMLGHTREELMAAGIRDITHPADVTEDERLSALLAKGDIGFFRMEKRYVRKDHSIIWGLLTAAAIRDEAGNVVRYVRQVEDITERKRAEEALRESEQRLRTVVEHSPVILFTLDAEGLFTFLDGEALKTLGVQVESLLGEPIWDQSWVTGNMAETIRSVLTGASVNEVVAFGDRSFDVQMAPIEREGIVMGATGVMLDVTDRRALEAQLRRSQRLESLGQFAGGIAHDFNNLLTVINGHAELVVENLEPGDSLRDEVRTILEAGQRGSALTKQLLAFSRRQVIEPRLIDLNEVVGNLEGMLRRLLGARVELVTDLGRGLGMVRADPGQMEQVLMNLVINARDAMPNGGRVTLATMPCADRPGSVCLRVADNGTGMSGHTREHLFDPFFTTKEQGTGLGLATVHGIVLQAGGEIEVEGTEGEGTVFTVRLLMVTDGASGPRSIETSGAQILVVEPDDGVRRLLVTVLQRQGYVVRQASRAEEAMDTQPGSVRLVLASLALPGITAPEFVRQLRRMGVEEPVVFTAGDGDPGAIEEAARLGAEFIRRPLTADDLVRRVRETLERTRTTRDF